MRRSPLPIVPDAVREVFPDTVALLEKVGELYPLQVVAALSELRDVLK
jgi:hypothetical protein